MYGGVNTQNFFQSFNRLLLWMQAINLNKKHHDELLKFHEAALAAGAQLPPPPAPPRGTALNVEFEYSLNYNESLISRARNRLVDQFLKSCTCTHALFIDADIGFDPIDVLGMLEMDRDIVGVPCSKKSIRWDRVQRAIRKHNKEFTADELARIGGDFVFNFEKFDGIRQIDMGEMQEMRNMGTGMLMIKREVFLKFKEEYPDRWFEPRSDPSFLPGPIHDFFRVGINPDTREYDSEDYWFCMDCKAIGFKIWMCPWVRTTHMGAHVYQGDLPATVVAGEI
jgi:hypothetical protein